MQSRDRGGSYTTLTEAGHEAEAGAGGMGNMGAGAPSDQEDIEDGIDDADLSDSDQSGAAGNANTLTLLRTQNPKPQALAPELSLRMPKL